MISVLTIQKDKKLIKQVVEESTNSWDGFTAYHFAAYERDRKLLQLLLGYDADKTLARIAVRGKTILEGFTTLQIAARQGSEESVEALLKHDKALAIQQVSAK